MDTLDAMKVFLRVADAGGFAAAARQMDLTPASVTRAVQSLEERVGMRLLQRTTRSVRLTQTGERYLQTVRRMLVEIEEIEDALRHERSSEVSGTLRLSMPVALGRAISCRCWRSSSSSTRACAWTWTSATARSTWWSRDSMPRSA